MKSAGNGRVYLRKDLDVSKYIDHCYRTGTVSILLDDGGVVDNVVCDKSRFLDIEWPESTTKLGSQVFWVMNADSNQQVVVAVVNKVGEIIPFKPYVKGIRSQSNDGVAEILINGKQSMIILNSNSQTANGGDIYILSNNKNNSSKLKIFVSSDIDISSKHFDIQTRKKLSIVIRDTQVDSKQTTLVIEKGKGMIIEDEFGNKYEMNDKGIIINEGKKGGIPNIEELTTIVNTLQKNIDILKIGTAAGFTTLSALDSGASSTAFNSASIYQPISTSGLEDEKVKH